MGSDYNKEINNNIRFDFGNNWKKYLKNFDMKKVVIAEESLKNMLDVGTLEGKSFIDVGCGSGIFSFAALRLGANVHSFDYDYQSVSCAIDLKRINCSNNDKWTIEEGSILDDEYVSKLGKWDVVYSWGVLHHTGCLLKSLENVEKLVADGGKLFIAIYNDQGRSSNMWLIVKKAYNKFPKRLRWIVLFPAFLRLWGPTFVRDFFKGHPFYTWNNYEKESLRAMSPWRDVVDWVGGLPFEVARPEVVFDFYRVRGFGLERLITCAGGHGCNQFVFTRCKAIPVAADLDQPDTKA